ncbi:3-methyl-2-oxobutanoate hydroxymethyltransferase [Halobellus rubicundus]|uniref:3-methyl-2-oxobutanoate hydroxymethyltransferase n=1 Tax=Halobellus rubicundus TaxID=2996466 RepID=A0ABD5M956_9EURY
MVTVADLREQDEPITMLTAYDAPTAELVDEAGIDSVLVGDSLGNAMLGYDSTIPVTMDDVARATAAVARAVDEALVISDLPFLSYGVDPAESVANAGRLLKEAGAQAVKIESGPHTVELTERLTQVGIPVMAHLGLTPQHVHGIGGYARQGTTEEQAAEILDLAEAHQEAGAFGLVMEHVPREVGAAVTEALEIPVIGIGAGPDTDGQVLVVNDAVGLSPSVPSFARAFGDVRGEMRDAIEAYRDAVVEGTFPDDDHSHSEGLDL